MQSGFVGWGHRNCILRACAWRRTELNVLQKVHHPHCVQFLGACTHAQPYMIVTEFLPGGSLTDLFKCGPYLLCLSCLMPLAVFCVAGARARLLPYASAGHLRVH